MCKDVHEVIIYNSKTLKTHNIKQQEVTKLWYIQTLYCYKTVI